MGKLFNEEYAADLEKVRIGRRLLREVDIFRFDVLAGGRGQGEGDQVERGLAGRSSKRTDPGMLSDFNQFNLQRKGVSPISCIYSSGQDQHLKRVWCQHFSEHFLCLS